MTGRPSGPMIQVRQTVAGTGSGMTITYRLYVTTIAGTVLTYAFDGLPALERHAELWATGAAVLKAERETPNEHDPNRVDTVALYGENLDDASDEDLEDAVRYHPGTQYGQFAELTLRARANRRSGAIHTAVSLEREASQIYRRLPPWQRCW